ncbi:transmembrane protein 272-like [Acipenser oxyrinchus oxyrinchus]|uniref:Transmembrane protein 272-like n=1 Tax=Acipenser oxyrinchus oxyrinchus TaxID=40147 RepID=A0AAD8CE44_ACIOX|nr:transmembrane protein 272-like [Acipenser oxyrinchus oxyrinchus]
MDDHRNLLDRMPSPPSVPPRVSVLSKIIATALPIAQIAIGSLYRNDCPVQPYIPIYLIVSGVFVLVLDLVSCVPQGQEGEEGATVCHNLIKTLNSLASLFLFIWFITGNVWIYSIYEPSYDAGSLVTKYCNKTLYLFAFWSTTVVYIIVGVMLLGGCCLMVCMCALGGAGLRSEDV